MEVVDMAAAVTADTEVDVEAAEDTAVDVVEEEVDTERAAGEYFLSFPHQTIRANSN